MTPFGVGRQRSFDLIVVGGGASGCGVALDASSRGLKVALIEAQDIASGTSSASSKLIHGGLRYLESLEFSLVAEALKERAHLLRNAPNIVKPLEFTIPVFANSKVGGGSRMALYDLTLTGYDLVGSLRSSKRHRRLTATQARKILPTIATTGLYGAMSYPDAFCDDARLILSVAMSAQRYFGATIATRHEVRGIKSKAEGGYEVIVADSLSGQEHLLLGRSVVVATGTSTIEVASLGGGTPAAAITPAKGVHLVVPFDKLPVNGAAAIDVPRDDRRIFVIPWGRYTYFGTTDTPYHQRGEPQVEPEDVKYLLDAVNKTFSKELSSSDLTGAWAGLRPLIAPASAIQTTKISRKHHLEEVEPGLFLLAGGKLTTYRAMAQDTVDAVAGHLGGVRRSHTHKLALWGALRPDQYLGLKQTVVGVLDAPSPSGLAKEDIATSLIERYGSEAARVVQGFESPGDLNEVFEGAGVLRGEVRYMTSVEGAKVPSDIVMRRSRIGILNSILGLKLARVLAEQFSSEFAEDQAIERDLNSLEENLPYFLRFKAPKDTSETR